MSSEKVPALDVIRTFLAVYRTGSFTSAAKLLAVTQPTVTNHISVLERQLERELFTRSAAGTHPTPLAHEMAAAVGNHVDHIERFFRDDVLNEKPIRTIHFGGPLEFTTVCLIPALARHATHLPRIEVVFDVADKLIADLTSGRLDLIVSTVRPRVEGVTALPIADEEFWLVAAPAVAAGATPRSGLRGLPVISYHRNLPIIRRYWTTVFGHEPNFEPNLVLPNLLAVKAAVLHGYGITVLPSYLIRDDVAAGALVKLDEPEVAPLNTLFLAAQTATLTRRSHIRNAATLILDAVKAFQRTANSEATE